MKPQAQRKIGQAVAHLRINCASDVVANSLLRHGTIIAGRRLQTHKWIPDPKRCFKCQELNPGHLAAECKAKQTTCGTCGAKTHRTQECTISDPTKFYCTNCRRSGHGTWGRACPAMLQTRARMIDRQPEYRYVLYPIMTDRSTWEQIHEPDTYFQHHDTHPAYAQHGFRGARQEIRRQPPPLQSRPQREDWSNRAASEAPWATVPERHQAPTREQPPSQRDRERAAAIQAQARHGSDSPLTFPPTTAPNSPTLPKKRLQTPFPDTPDDPSEHSDDDDSAAIPHKTPITRIRPSDKFQSTIDSHLNDAKGKPKQPTHSSSSTLSPPTLSLPPRPHTSLGKQPTTRR